MVGYNGACGESRRSRSSHPVPHPGAADDKAHESSTGELAGSAGYSLWQAGVGVFIKKCLNNACRAGVLITSLSCSLDQIGEIIRLPVTDQQRCAGAPEPGVVLPPRSGFKGLRHRPLVSPLESVRSWGRLRLVVRRL